MTTPMAAIVLAAGKGTRMKSDLPKVLHRVAGRPLITYPLELCKKLKLDPVIVVMGKNQSSLLKTIQETKITSIQPAIQDPPLGTGHAVMAAIKKLERFQGDILILNGDTPFVQLSTLREFIQEHQLKKAGLSLVTAVMDEPGSYGRIIRNKQGEPCEIKEAKEATLSEKNIREINVGIYLIGAHYLREWLPWLQSQNAQKEYYLTDLVQLADKNKIKVGALCLQDPFEGSGINTPMELTQANQRMFQKKIQECAATGVNFMSTGHVMIESQVKIGSGTVIYPPCYFLGNTSIGKNCVIEPGVIIKNSQIGDGVTLKAYTYIDESEVAQGALIGPFAHLRPGSEIGSEVKIGNFVEIKKSQIQKKSKVNHLSYIGDAQIGESVNVGAGTITCNYDGVNKFKTILEDGVFVGSDTQFVAPVRVGRGAFIGAGSTITKDVAEGSLALSRAQQLEVKGWTKRKSKARKLKAR